MLYTGLQMSQPHEETQQIDQDGKFSRIAMNCEDHSQTQQSQSGTNAEIYHQQQSILQEYILNDKQQQQQAKVQVASDKCQLVYISFSQYGRVTTNKKTRKSHLKLVSFVIGYDFYPSVADYLQDLVDFQAENKYFQSNQEQTQFQCYDQYDHTQSKEIFEAQLTKQEEEDQLETKDVENDYNYANVCKFSKNQDGCSKVRYQQMMGKKQCGQNSDKYKQFQKQSPTDKSAKSNQNKKGSINFQQLLSHLFPTKTDNQNIDVEELINKAIKLSQPQTTPNNQTTHQVSSTNQTEPTEPKDQPTVPANVPPYQTQNQRVDYDAID